MLQGCGSHVTMLVARDLQVQTSAAPPAPPPPDSAPITTVPAVPPEVPPQCPVSKTVSSGFTWLSWRHQCWRLFIEFVFYSLQPNLEGYEIHEVPLTKKDGQSLGISIIGFNSLTSQGTRG